MQITKGYSLKP